MNKFLFSSLKGLLNSEGHFLVLLSPLSLVWPWVNKLASLNLSFLTRCFLRLSFKLSNLYGRKPLNQKESRHAHSSF
jgi:hypothetical protein